MIDSGFYLIVQLKIMPSHLRIARNDTKAMLSTTFFSSTIISYGFSGREQNTIPQSMFVYCIGLEVSNDKQHK